ncbi:MAG: BREX-1 system adenine-specific DNA-methyltransferase PglX [Desulfobacteraceae bacterium]|nr:BREX-1 system adenine-specific DNA-methyltransferase PglX [Desulfobacteraceae bacterium]
MNTNKLKVYAPKARRDFIKAVTDRAAFYGLTKEKIEPVSEQGDVAIIGGKPFPIDVAKKRKRLEERIRREGFEQVMEAMAYTWFNRFVAIRFTELHGYLEHGYRVLSTTNSTNDTNKGGTVSGLPEILVYAEHVDLPGLDREKVVELKLEGNRDEELYRMLLIAQCNALHKAMPFLFERIGDATELLLPENLLHSDSLIRKMVSEIPEEEWEEVEIIGWLYQFYISEKKDQVIGNVVKSEDIPAATQLFTPNWIVKYMVQNTLGRQWVATYPNSPLKKQMEYYIEPAEQTPEVQEQLKAITPEGLNPEELTLLDPACGSGHILVEAYDLLKAIYQERGYRTKDIPHLILKKNLYGLEIDDRAAQLAGFALMMKARSDDRRIFDNGTKPHVLAIQESKGMDAEKITTALNAPIVKGELPPREMLFEEMDAAHTPLFSRKNLSVKGAISQDDVEQLIQLFEHGKTFGSLIRVPENLHGRLGAIVERVEDVCAYGELFGKSAAEAVKPIVEQARILAERYNTVAANPPYMGGRNGMNLILKAFAEKGFPDTKADLFAMFIQRGSDFTTTVGHNAMVTMQSWMFLSSFERMRERLLGAKTLITMAHLGPRSFGSISGEVVQTTVFALMNTPIKGFKPTFFRLVDGEEDSKRAALLQRSHRYCDMTQDNFVRVPGSPLAYWMPHTLVDHFLPENQLLKYSDQRQGLATGDDDRFLRYWYEIDVCTFNNNNLAFPNNEKRWFPFIKGGTFRKWYGNNEFVIRFDEASCAVLENQGNCLPNRHLYMKESIVWSDVAASVFGARLNTEGKVFGTGALSAFPKNGFWKYYILGFLNSCIHNFVINSISSGLHYHTGYVSKSPLLLCEPVLPFVNEVVKEAVKLSLNDWDSHETSWDFTQLPLLGGEWAVGGRVKQEKLSTLLSEPYAQLLVHWRGMTLEMQRIEEESNRIFIEAYGLHNELTPDVPISEITLTCNPHYRYGGNKSEEELEALLLADTIKDLISYSIGCIMGRYSLDQPGLIYAHSGNNQFWEIYHEKHNQPNPTQNNSHSSNSCDSWSTYPPDQDGIIPITDTDWFPDDAANRFIEFISVAWPKEHLEENLKFVAESLGPKRGEAPRETIRRYISTGFFKHHMKMYKKRPIYWLFSSGKLRAFQCLVYLHRYNEGTLSRTRTEYVIPLQGKISARIEQLSGDIGAATSTAHRKKLEREKDKLAKQQVELQGFDEKLRHYADQRISLDLDDGVKVNYGKFGDLLAEVKAVTGKKKE